MNDLLTMKSFYSNNRLVNKYSAQQKGVINPLLIGGVVVLGIVVFLVSSGALKFSGSVKVDDKNKGQAESQVSQPATQPTEKPKEKPKAEVKLNPEPFTDSKLGFSISYPEGWKPNSATTNATFYKPSDTKGEGKADALVTVFSAAIGELKDYKLATIADLHKLQLKKQFSNLEFIKEGDVKVGDQDAYEMEFTGAMGGENMHGRYMVLTSSTNLYAILGGANTGLWNDLKDTINASIQTFKKQ